MSAGDLHSGGEGPNRHDCFGFPERLDTLADLAAVEIGNTLFPRIAEPGGWDEYVAWRTEIDSDHAADDHRCGEDDCVWCPMSDAECDEHVVAVLRSGRPVAGWGRNEDHQARLDEAAAEIRKDRGDG